MSDDYDPTDFPVWLGVVALAIAAVVCAGAWLLIYRFITWAVELIT